MKRTASTGEWIVRMSVGPLALAAFFLPWAHGPGPLAATEFTGYKLVGYAGRLQALDLSPTASGVLWGIRLLILAVAVAAVWHTILAPWWRHHPAYRLSGYYVAALAAICATIGVLRAGIEVPPLGLTLLLVAATVFVTIELIALRRPTKS